MTNLLQQKKKEDLIFEGLDLSREANRKFEKLFSFVETIEKNKGVYLYTFTKNTIFIRL